MEPEILRCRCFMWHVIDVQAVPLWRLSYDEAKWKSAAIWNAQGNKKIFLFRPEFTFRLIICDTLSLIDTCSRTIFSDCLPPPLRIRKWSIRPTISHDVLAWLVQSHLSKSFRLSYFTFCFFMIKPTIHTSRWSPMHYLWCLLVGLSIFKN